MIRNNQRVVLWILASTGLFAVVVGLGWWLVEREVGWLVFTFSILAIFATFVLFAVAMTSKSKKSQSKILPKD